MNTVPPGDADLARFARDIDHLICQVCERGDMVAEARFALAISGGPDSMALLALAAAAHPNRVNAATFDHQLRPAAAEEARLVADVCAALDVPHAILVPAVPIAGASIQAQAREARYAALLDWAGNANCNFLLTAHHADDQAETLLMRLNRASGLAGLSAIRRVRHTAGATILRPLLGWRRSELRAIVTTSGLPFVDDPSNGDRRYDRTRIRALLAANPDLDPVALAASAAYLGDAEEAIDRAVMTLWEERWRGPDRPLMLHDLPRELQRRLIYRAVAETRRALGIILPRFGEGANVEAVLDATAAGRVVTLGGLMVVPSGAGWIFRAAPPRRSH